MTPDSTSVRAALVRSVLILRPLAGDDAFSAMAQLVEGVRERYAAIAEPLAIANAQVQLPRNG